MADKLFTPGTLYVDRVSPNDRKVLDEISAPRHWDSEIFSKVLVALAKVGRGASISGSKRPESIHLQGLRPFVDKLIAETAKTGKEHARVFFADVDKGTLVGGKTTRGNSDSVHLNFDTQPGRDKFQKPVLTVHVHPDSIASHGFSAQDYAVFLSDLRQQAMMIAYSPTSRLMILKTSVTPNSSRDSVLARIKGTEADFIQKFKTDPLASVVEFNKTVCIELGLVLYLASEKSNDTFERVPLVPPKTGKGD
ncbi:hypothetical protein K2X83_00405 [Patescibacteria group bacterium]|nr:hypothetical protein [Patescibacteria group bacterium]